MKLSKAPRTLGLDTVVYVTPFMDAMYRMGYRTIMRYIRRDEHVNDKPDLEDWFQSLSKQELDELTGKGFVVGLVQVGVGKRSDVDAAAGTRVGEAAAWNAMQLGAPSGTVVFCDCEWDWEEGNIPDKATRMAYVDAWGRAVKAESNGVVVPGLYVSADLGFTSEELYGLANIHAYWKSASIVPSVDTRGYQIVQSIEQCYRVGSDEVVGWDRRYQGEVNAGNALRFDADMMCADGRGDWYRGVGQ